VLVFCVQHSGISRVAAAAHIDPVYARTFAEAVAAGVEVMAYRAELGAAEIVLREALPVATGRVSPDC
jgi:sugar fermentation stimulation protein A